jgi:SNF2 family DNA or RNA helicase
MKPFAHQQKAIDIAIRQNLALFHDCGTGKTFTALHIIKNIKRKIKFGPALVVCPLSIIEAAWIEDCKKFTPELSIVSLWSKNPAKRKKALAEDHDIYVANFETAKYLYPEINDKGFGSLFVDESSKMKNPKAQITKALLSLAGIHFRGSHFKMGRPIPNRYVLSGTPAPNDESEYWAQIKFITGPGGQCFNDNYYAFRGKYFSTIMIGPTARMFKFRNRLRDEFMEAMKPVTHVVRKEDAVDLPEQIHNIRKVYLSPAEKKAYKTLEDEFVLEFKDESVLATTALVEVMKLRQITSGFVYGDTETHKIGCSKLTELKGLLDEIGDHQVIIWANFKHEIRTLLEDLNPSGTLQAAAIWSETDNRDEVIKLFQTGKIKYLIANPQSAAHGLTFVNCQYAVYFSMNYSYELQKQSEDRIHRIGQNKHATYYHLVADGTIDEVICKAVKRKKDLSTSVLDYLRSK